MKALEKIQGRIDNLSLRERGIVLGAIIVLTYFLFDQFIYLGIENRQKIIQANLLQNKSTVSAMTSQLEQLSGSGSGNKKEQKKQEIRDLRNELTQLDQELNQSTTNLVVPGKMASLLQTVLASTNGLTMVKLQKLDSEPLINQAKVTQSNDIARDNDSDDQIGTSTAVSNAFRHRMQVEIEGDFFSTLEYLKKLEALDKSFFWDEIRFEVSEYPRATSVLTIYTISLDENWIGA